MDSDGRAMGVWDVWHCPRCGARVLSHPDVDSTHVTVFNPIGEHWERTPILADCDEEMIKEIQDT